MKKSRFTEEQIIGFIKQAQAGLPIKELCRKGGFSDATFYKWRAKYGDLDQLTSFRLWSTRKCSAPNRSDQTYQPSSRWRARCAATFMRFPHTAIEHQRRLGPRLLSANSMVQFGFSHL